MQLKVPLGRTEIINYRHFEKSVLPLYFFLKIRLCIGGGGEE